jgi:NADH-ubiquinone oxidoreductase chain 6
MAILSLIFGIFSVSSSHRPHYALIYLIGTFVSASLLLILSGVLFVGVSYLIVYVGAILVLFLFVVLLMDVSVNYDPLSMNSDIMSIRVISILSIILVLSLYSVFNSTSLDLISANNYTTLLSEISPDTSVSFLNQIQSLATILYVGNGAPIVPIIALILMVAMLATLLHTDKKN